MAPRATAKIAAPLCVVVDPTGMSPLGVLSSPHVHCDLRTLTWRFHCLDQTGQLLWHVPL